MRGVSAKSLAAVIGAVNASPGSLGDLGDELFSVVGILDQSPRLRRILTDPAIDTEAQNGLAGTMFGGKVNDATLNVVKAAAGARWSSGRDMSDALEIAGVAAHVAEADKNGELDALETGLFEFGRVVEANGELRGVITDRSVPLAPKKALVGTLLNSKVSTGAEALAKQAVAARTGSFEKALAAFSRTAAERRNKLLAEVTIAYEPSDEEKQRLAAALSKKYDRDVHLNIIVDPDVIGGITVAVGDQVIDGSVSSRLEDARRRIAG